MRRVYGEWLVKLWLFLSIFLFRSATEFVLITVLQSNGVHCTSYCVVMKKKANKNSWIKYLHSDFHDGLELQSHPPRQFCGTNLITYKFKIERVFCLCLQAENVYFENYICWWCNYICKCTWSWMNLLYLEKFEQIIGCTALSYHCYNHNQWCCS